MNRKLLGLMAIATTVLATSAVVSVVSLNAAEKAEPAQVNATNTIDSFIYFDTLGYKNDSRWSNPDCYFRYWTGAQNKTVKLTKLSNQYWYGKIGDIDMPNSGGFCIRNSSVGSDDNNETSWISWSSWSSQSYNSLQLKGVDEDGRCGVNWLTLSEVPSSIGGSGSTSYVSIGGLAPSYSTQRVWCRSSDSGWYSNGSDTAVRAWTASGTTVYRTTSIYDGVNSLFYWYADIPLSVDGFQFVRVSAGFDGIYTYSANGTSSAGSLINYIYLDSTYKISYAAIPDGQLSANVAAKVLEGYSTCSSNSINGYPAVSSLSANWLNEVKMTSGEWSSFLATSISDYPYEAYHTNSDLYSSEQSKSATTTCGDKWTRMQSEALKPTSLNLHGEENETFADSISTLGAFALLVSLGLGGFVLFRKRKSVN